MTDSRIWILGAPDPEMAAIEQLLRECGETVVYATTGDGERVTPATAYRAHCPDLALDRIRSRGGAIYLVECDLADARFGTHSPEYTDCAAVVERIDHHQPGDPGFGRPPSEFLAASSIGQVIAELARLGRLPEAWPRLGTPEGCMWRRGELVTRGGHPDQPCFPLGWWVTTCEEGETGDAGWGPDGGETADVPRDLVLCAAADHCLGAAYRGECPGVDPDDLMRWRAESRAKFQGRTVEDVLADVERAQAALRAAPELVLSEHLCEWHLGRPGSGGDCVNAAGTDYSEDPCSAVVVRDMRQPVDQRPTRELPEAAARLGIGYVSGPLVGPDGRQKITCSGTADQVRAFLDHWAPAQGLVDAYGDPARGFAGAYLREEVES